MKRLFVDTSYFLALLIPDDFAHDKALDWARHAANSLVTTEYVVVEMGNYLSQSSMRGIFMRWLDALRRDSRVAIVEASAAVLQRGVELFNARPDKNWSLTDCISFVVMTEHGLDEALTADHHFEQAGFVAPLK